MESLWEVSHKRSFERYHPRPTAASPSPRLGVRNPTPKLQAIGIISGTATRTANLANTFIASTRTQAHEKFWRKGSVGVSRHCPIFWVRPFHPRNGQSYDRTSNLAGFFTASMRTKLQKPLKNLGEKGQWAYSGTAQFFEYPLFVAILLDGWQCKPA